MKHLLSILTVFIGLQGHCQTYSSIVPDSAIINFILWDLQTNYMFPSPDSSERKIKIFQTIYPWSDIEFECADSITNVSVQPFEDQNLFIDLKRVKNIEISREEEKYMQDQIKAINYKNGWVFPGKNIKIQKKHGNLKRKTTYFISIPIFSKDKSLVFLKRSMYCGSLCAEHAVFIYQRIKGNGYKIIHFTNYWMS